MPMRFVFLVLVILALAVGAYWFSNVSLVDDQMQPEILVNNPPRGLGQQARVLAFEVSDSGAGLDRVSVNLKQRGYSKELFRKSLQGLKNFKHSFEITAEQAYLVEGPADLEIKALDRSLAGNPKIKVIPVQIDFKAPKLRGISSQHNLQSGGVQLAFYEIEERALYESGVQVGELRFIGYPAKLLDSTLDVRGLYAVIYTVPAGVSAKPYLFAEDLAGNLVKSSFYNLVLKRNFGKQKVSLKPWMLEEFAKVVGLPVNESSKVLSAKIRELRLAANLEMAKTEASAKSERMWRGSFQKPSGSVRTSFGANLEFVDQAETLLSYSDSGYAFSDPGQDLSVSAPNAGLIVFAGSLPFYGQSIIISHGFGLSSVLGNLSEVQVKLGERVHAGQVLGIRSQGGIFGKGTIFFEMRLQGIPIEPREWWDATWLKQHFDDKIREVKGNYGQ